MFRDLGFFILMIFIVGNINSCTLNVRDLPDNILLENEENGDTGSSEEDESDGEAVVGCKSFIQGFVDAMNVSDCDEAGINLDKIIVENCDEPATLITRLEQFRAAECSLTCSQWFTFADTEFFVANYAKAKELLSAMEGSGCEIGCTEMMLSVQVFLKTGDLMLAQIEVTQMDAASCDNTAEALALCRAAGACL